MTDVFISYKREERENARRVAEALQKRGFSVWWDAEILPGEQYRTVTQAILQSCKAAIVIWSPKSVDSSWVLDEAQRALDRGVLIPVNLETLSAYPLGFGQVHAHDLTSWDGAVDHLAFQPVVTAVQRLVNEPEAKTTTAAPRKRKRKAAASTQQTESAEPQKLVGVAPSSAFGTYELAFIAIVTVLAAFIAWPIANSALGMERAFYAEDYALLLSLATPQNIFIMTPLLVGAAWAYDRGKAMWAARGGSASHVQYGVLALLIVFLLLSLGMREHGGRETHLALLLLCVWAAASYARPAVARLRPHIDRQMSRRN